MKDGIRDAVTRRMALGLALGAGAGYLAKPEATDQERMGNVLVGTLAGEALLPFTTLALTKLILRRAERNKIDPRRLASHPELPDRVRAMMLAAAEQTEEGQKVRVPALIPALQKLGGERLQELVPLLDGNRTAEEVREMVARQMSPQDAGRTLRELALELAIGQGLRHQRSRELWADDVTVRFPSGPAGRGLATPVGESAVKQMVEDLANAMGVPVPIVTFKRTQDVNALGTWGRSKSPQILITDGLLQAGLTADELRDVLIHELAHTTDEEVGWWLFRRARQGAEKVLNLGRTP